MIGIYKITNPNGKVYIGQSTNIERRFRYYKGGDCKVQYALFRSLIKYGWVNHIFEIIEQCDLTELDTKERYYQEKYDVLSNNGLNCFLTEANGKKRVFSAETIDKLSKTAKERVVSELKRKNHSDTMKGRKYSDEHKRKISEGNKGKLHWWNIGKPTTEKQKMIVSEKLKQPILQFSKDGLFIKEWDSTKSAKLFYKKGGSGISACLNGKHKTAIGFIWRKKIK